jgi:hypothetical protein
MAKQDTRSWLIGVALIFIGMIIMVKTFPYMQVRADEYLVYHFTRNDLGFLIRLLAESDVHPPLWFSSFWGWRQIFGDSEFVGRIYAVFLSMLTFAGVYQIGRRWFGAARYGLFAIMVLGVNALFLNYAIEIRPYAMIMLLVTASMWFYQRWLAGRRWRDALCYGLSVAAMLYVHYFLFVLIVIQVLYFVGVHGRQKALWKQAFGAAGFALLIWLPWVPAVVNQITILRQGEILGGNARGIIGSGATTMPTSWRAISELIAIATNGLWPLYALVLAVSLWFGWRRRNYRLALVWALGVPVVSMAFNLFLAIYTPRYVVYLVLGLALILAFAFAALPWRRLSVGLLLAFTGVSLMNVPTQLPPHIPYRELFGEVSRLAQPGDVIFIDQPQTRDSDYQQWILGRYLRPDLRENRVYTVEDALPHRRIWHVTEHWMDDAVRDRFRQIEAGHPLQFSMGNCTSAWCYHVQLLEGPPNAAPSIFGEGLAFWGVDIESVTNDTLSARLWWVAEMQQPLDYSIGVQLFDANGLLVAQHDGPVKNWYTGEDVQTSQLTPGHIYIDHRQLTLPESLPPGNYTLSLIVYQYWDNARLTLENGMDLLDLKTIYLGDAP